MLLLLWLHSFVVTVSKSIGEVGILTILLIVFSILVVIIASLPLIKVTKSIVVALLLFRVLLSFFIVVRDTLPIIKVPEPIASAGLILFVLGSEAIILGFYRLIDYLHWVGFRR